MVIGTHQKGIYFFNTADKKFDKISIPESIEENGLLINDIVVDQLSRIWVGTNYGVFIIDKNTRCLLEFLLKVQNKNPNNTDVFKS